MIGMASAAFCHFLLLHFHQGAADFGWAVRAARHVLAGQNPYNTPLEQYPLTAAFFGVPFVWLRPEMAAALFYGISSALLAFGLIPHGYHRLLVFLAYPYWGGLLAVQWSTLIFASAFFPLLLPVTMAKPQLGLPVAITSPQPTRAHRVPFSFCYRLHLSADAGSGAVAECCLGAAPIASFRRMRKKASATGTELQLNFPERLALLERKRGLC